jgi:hypothetical protein
MGGMGIFGLSLGQNGLRRRLVATKGMTAPKGCRWPTAAPEAGDLQALRGRDRAFEVEAAGAPNLEPRPCLRMVA